MILSLWTSPASRLWLLWWLLAASGQQLVLGYFQLQLLQAVPTAPFGGLEALVEAGLAIGALLGARALPLAARRPRSPGPNPNPNLAGLTLG